MNSWQTISIPTKSHKGVDSITVTSWWARRRLKSPASRLFTQSFIQVQTKENIKAPRHWPLWGEFTGDPPPHPPTHTQRASSAENVSIWWRHHGNMKYRLTKTRIPIVEIRQRYDSLISTMAFPVLIRRHYYIDELVQERRNTIALTYRYWIRTKDAENTHVVS